MAKRPGLRGQPGETIATAGRPQPTPRRRLQPPDWGAPMRAWTQAAARAPALRRPDRFALLLAAIAAFGAGLVLARNAANGVLVRGDSIHYVSMARSLLEGDGFLPWWGDPVAYWAPLFPAALAIGSLFVFDPLDVAGPLNAAAFGLTILAVGRWLRRRLASRFLAAWCCLAVAFSVPVAGVASFAWSEPLFILLVTLSLSETDRYLETGRRGSLVRTAVFASLACLTRYTGVALAAATLLLLALRPGAAPREKARDLAAFAAATLFPLSLWLLRNLLLTGTLAAERPPSGIVLQDNLRLALEVLASWLRTPPQADPVLPASAMLIALDAIACVGFIRWLQRGRGPAAAPVAGLFAFAYLAAMIAAVTTAELTLLDDRYLSPAYVPLLVLFAVAADRTLGRLRGLRLPFAARPRLRALWRRAAFAAPAAALGLWAWQAGSGEVRATWEAVAGPAPEWTVRHWENDSPTFRWLRAHPPQGRVYGNARPLVHLFALADPARNLDLPATQEALAAQLTPGDYVVLFHETRFGAPPAYGTHDLDLPGLRTEAWLGDAMIFVYGED